MPGKDLGAGGEVLPPLNLGSLKGHKVLPRRKVVSNDTDHGRSIRQERRMKHKSEQISYSSAERIKSWIPEASSIQVIPVVGKPLTPPINFRDDFQSWINDVALRGRDFPRTRTSDSPGTTPLVQQSPPTPETTPPNIHRTRTAASRSSTRNTSDGRTDSFKTAQEEQSSDDESQPLDSPSKHPARVTWLRAAGLSKHKDIGLGLGLELVDEGTTSREMTPRHIAKHRGFGTFDGIWDPSDEDRQESGSQEDHSSATSVPYDRRSQRPSRKAELPSLDSPTLGQEIVSSSKKSLGLRQRVERNGHSLPTPSTEKIADKIHWPLNEDYFDVDSEIRDLNNKRLSQASTTSTVVEAMVIQSPPRRRQTLRHTVKMEDMNSSTPPPSSNRNSLNSNERSSLRRRLRRSGSLDQELRKSYASADTPESVGSNLLKARQDPAPATTIPDRPFSLQSSASGSKALSRTFSFNSRQQSSRPTTAPEESVGYFDVPTRRDRRTMSVVIHPPKSSKSEDRPEKGVEPPALAQLSSPSVPTSSEVSRTTSVTSAGIGTYHDPPMVADQPHATFYLSDPPDEHSLSVDRNMGEWSAIRPRSTLVTPFSLRSAHSSTPGTLEVNEATAISIYPHTNKSILVIQQMAGGSDSSPKEQSAIIAGNANIALPGSITPIIHHQSPPREILTSPLQNPRDAPQPPDLRVIAPTPANGRPSSEATPPTPSTPTRPNRFSAPISSIKRNFSARRVSDTFVAPFTRTFTFRGTTNIHRRRTIAGDPEPGSKLHPFWRPRGFWDDVDDSDSDEEFGNTGFLTGSRRPSQSTKETTPQRTASLTHRLRGSLRFPHSPQRLRRLSVFSEINQDLYEFVNANNGRNHEESKRDGVLIQPKFQGDKERKGDTTPRRTMSLTRRLTGSLRLSHPAYRQRPSSVTHPTDNKIDVFAPAGSQGDEGRRENAIPRRTMSLTRRLTGSIRLPHREWRERPLSISGPMHPHENESTHPKVKEVEERKPDATTRPNMSLSRRLTGSLRLPRREQRERPYSISAPLHPNENEFINPKPSSAEEWKPDATPRRTMSLPRRLTRSLQHPPRPPRPLWMSSPLDQDDYEFVHANVHHNEEQMSERMPRLGYPVHFVGFKAFAEKLERRREAREEGKREERRRWLTDRIKHVGTDDAAMRTEHFKREMGGW
ncbi:hypothetical protein IMSHALPRED_002539 [Imshaugia aleurites]|uniref:Uncharacterized protein n=1 Tax=Imshaugia aleurites TaxID=172621 RepID=A0A8H3J652_9LECA|nr:hypothetical protein IMSHALPRED_002539 [Imshaugia aleurites]